MSALLVLVLAAQSEVETLLEQLKTESTRQEAHQKLIALAVEKDIRDHLSSSDGSIGIIRAAADYRWSVDDEMARILHGSIGFGNMASAFKGGDANAQSAILLALFRFPEPGLVPLLRQWSDVVDDLRSLWLILRSGCGDEEVTDRLIPLLGHESPAIASRALGVLAPIAEKKHLPALLALLDDPRALPNVWPVIESIDAESLRVPARRNLANPVAPIRTLAAMTLGRLRDTAAMDTLVSAVEHESAPQTRKAMVELLIKLGPPEGAGRIFERLARDGDPGMAKLGLQALIALGEEACVDPLLESLKHAHQQSVAGFAIEALNRIDKGFWIGAARSMLKSRSRELRANGAQLVGIAKDKRSLEAVVSLLADPEGYVRIRALEALRRIDPDRAATEAEALLTLNDPLVPGLAAGIIEVAEPGRTEAVNRKLLDSKMAMVKVGAFQRLIDLGVPDVLDLARELLKQKSGGVRTQALSVLLENKAPDAIDRLFDIFPETGKEGSYIWVLLERYGTDPELAPMFAKRLNDPRADERNRILAAGWLAYYGGEASPPALKRALDDASEFVRMAAAGSLARLGDTASAKPVFQELLKVESMSGSRDLYHGLARCGAVDEVLKVLAGKDSRLAIYGVEAVGLMRTRSVVPALEARLLNSSPRLHDAMLFALARMGNVTALRRLGRSVETILDSGFADRHPWLPDLVGYLAQLEGDEVRAALARAIRESGPGLRARFIQIVGRHTSPRNIELLRGSLDDRSTSPRAPELENGIREVALHVLLRMTGTRFDGSTDERIQAWEAWWKKKTAED